MGNNEFRNWIARFISLASRNGIAESVLEDFKDRVRFNEVVLQMAKCQQEHVLPVWAYVDKAVSAKRMSEGVQALRTQRGVLTEIESRYQVEPEVLVALWGIETAYGTKRGAFPVIDSLATLASSGHRTGLFERELLAALQIVQSDCACMDDLTGSWAGAMGHAQFMPSSYLTFGIDFRGRGAADIWGDDPADALASAAHFLRGHGWEQGLRWSFEVTLPADFDYRLTGQHRDRPIDEWLQAGVQPLDQVRFPDDCRAAVVLPAGALGPALLATGNFAVLRKYNRSLSYVLAVGHLSDRIVGRSGFRSAWPRSEIPLSRKEVLELQERLVGLGYDTGGVDGLAGPATTDSIQLYQSSVGLVPDGFPSRTVLDRLRG